MEKDWQISVFLYKGLSMLSITITVPYDVMVRSMVSRHQYCGGTSCIYVQHGRRQR